MKCFLFRSAAALFGAGIFAGALVACDDTKEPIEPPVETPEVAISSVEPAANEVKFVVTPAHAEKCAYLLFAGNEEALPSADDILRDGKQVPAATATPITEKNLEPETSYCIVAAAAAGERTVRSEPQRFTTLKKEEPSSNAEVLDRVVRATYFGVDEDAGFAANYYIQLANVECQKDEFGYWRPAGKGTLLSLDFWGDESTSAGIELPDGTYTINGVHDPLTINPYNTGVQISDGTESAPPTAFESGTAEVKTVDGVSTIRVSMNDGAHGLYEYVFTGRIEWVEYTPPVYDPISKDILTTFIQGDGFYYGDRDESGLGAFEIYIYDVPLRDGFLSRAGNMLMMDLLVPVERVGDKLYIPDGTYTIDGQSGGCRFVPGYVEEGKFYPVGTCCEQDDADGNPYYAAVSGGKIEFSRSGDTYTANIELTTLERITIKGTFSGKIPIEDRVGWRPGGGGFSTLHRDITVDLSGIEHGTLTYLGDYMRVGGSSFVLDISAEGWPEKMMIEVLCARENETDVAAGHYTVVPMGSSWDSFVPWSVIGGFRQDTRTTGSWYYHMDGTGAIDNGAPMNGGTLDISKEGELYTVTFEFEDDCTYPNKVSGTWTGRFDFVSSPF